MSIYFQIKRFEGAEGGPRKRGRGKSMTKFPAIIKVIEAAEVNVKINKLKVQLTFHFIFNLINFFLSRNWNFNLKRLRQQNKPQNAYRTSGNGTTNMGWPKVCSRPNRWQTSRDWNVQTNPAHCNQGSLEATQKEINRIERSAKEIHYKA